MSVEAGEADEGPEEMPPTVPPVTFPVSGMTLGEDDEEEPITEPQTGSLPPPTGATAEPGNDLKISDSPLYRQLKDKYKELCTCYDQQRQHAYSTVERVVLGSGSSQLSAYSMMSDAAESLRAAIVAMKQVQKCGEATGTFLNI
ncbi:hypothetical protein PAPYR_1107 [Paratrimastix pyriformis]|uniref:Uncharacterized protein n=1 Tax=Paratrimastix pyriformis TaxID=342808 RepID=A0ABQ8V064_9EUKA|nr:hypothetical protein PAPYR_1107 [Paratrimastix pyriformis]